MKRWFLIALLCCLTATSMSFAAKTTNTVRVPDVIGLQASGAKMILGRTGLKAATVVVTEEGIPGTVVKIMLGKKEIKPWAKVPPQSTIILGTVKEQLIKVPDLNGKTIEEATKLLEEKELKLGSVKKKPTTEAKPGNIIGQQPAKDEKVKKDNKISVTIAEVVMVKVPDLLGKTKEKAVSSLEKNNLRLGAATEKFSTEKPGIVIGQSPAQDLDVEISTEISIIIAKEQMMKVPSLRGKTEYEARKTLMNAQLKLGKITEFVDNRARVGTVLSQGPSAYSEVSKGTAVDIVIAKREMVDLPRVIGLKEPDAVAALKQRGFLVSVQQAETDQQPAGIVLKMQPAYGKYEKGTRVQIIVSKEKLQTLEPATTVENAPPKQDLSKAQKPFAL